MSKKKGDRRERLAREIFTEAEYAVENPNFSRFGNKDFYNLHDFMAVHQESEIIFVQVKSETASGINQFIKDCSDMFPPEHCKIFYMVYHKNQGWRLIEIDLENESREVIVDERDTTDNMGKNVTEYLQAYINGNT